VEEHLFHRKPTWFCLPTQTHAHDGWSLTDDSDVPNFHPVVFLLIATMLEVSGDALIRKGIYNNTGLARLALLLIGAALVFGYGVSLNLAPLEFGQVVGLYIATLFVVWQIINFVAFRTLPSLPNLVGGALIIAGGLIVTFWKPGTQIWRR
jgi:hypothetical protein